jgi:TatD DNase family protein
MLFDTHAHYDDIQYENDRDDVLKKIFESGVGYVLSVSVDVASTVENIALSQKYDRVYTATGIHPHNVKELQSQAIFPIEEFATHNKVVAIGEIGLDYYYENSPREEQKTWFAKQIALALRLGKPVIIHDRDAHKDTLDIVKAERAKEVGGVFHCFSGSVEMAREVLNQNFYISIAGPVTYKNAKKLVEVVRYLPEDRILIETDSPYLSPVPNRGKRNDSRNLVHIAEKISEIRGVSVDHIADITTQNAKRLFKIN